MRPSPSARFARVLGVLAIAAALAVLFTAVATATAATQDSPVAHAAKKKAKAKKRKKRPSALTLCLRRARKAHSAKTRASRARTCQRKYGRVARVAKGKQTTPGGSTSPALPPSTGTNSFGADVFGLALGGAVQGEDSTTLGRDLDSIQGTHTHWVRVDINWAQIQDGGSSSYNWTQVDRVVRSRPA